MQPEGSHNNRGRLRKPAGRKGKVLFLVLRVAILVVAGGALLGVVMAEVLLRLHHSPSGVRPQHYSLPSEVVEVLRPGGVRLRGWWIPAPENEGTILVCHGYGADKGDALAFAEFLHDAAFHVLVVDFRGHGESEGRTGSLGFYEVGDIKACIDWLDENDRIQEGKLGLFGYSMGGGIGLLVAADDERISAVAVDSAFADGSQTLARWLRYSLPLPRFPIIWAAMQWAEWRLGCDYSMVSPVHRIAEIAPRPVLLIHGENDRLIPPQDSRRLYDTAGDPKELWIVPDAGHVGSLDEEGAVYRRRVAEFFAGAFQSHNPLTPETGR